MTDGVEKVRAAFEAPETLQPEEGQGPPMDLPPLDAYDAPPAEPRTPDDAPPIEADGARFPLNDTGNGKRFALYYGKDCLPVPRVGWFNWDDTRWEKDPDEILARGKAQQVQDRIVQEIPHLVLEDWQLQEIEKEPLLRVQYNQLIGIDAADQTAEQQVEIEDLDQKLQWIRKLKDRKSSMKSDHRSFAKSSGNKGRIDAMLNEAKVDLSRNVDQLDANPLHVNTLTGTLHFKVQGGPGQGFSKTADFDLVDHDRSHLITKLMPLDYDADAKCPLFDTFLKRVQPDKGMRDFIQRWLAVSMTGLKVQKFAFFYGDGANGKSVLVDLIAKMLGEYAATAKIESLTGRNRRGGGDATPDLIPLVGARMARAAEPEEGERLQEGTIKELTGGEPIQVRSLHADFIEVQPIFKLTISGNHKPEIRGTDDGIWRRVLLVPFDVQIPENERDQQLGERLWSERSGIFNWLVEGLVDFLEGGLQEPKQVLEATLDYRADSDPIGSYLKECCVVTGDPSDFTTSRDLMDGFNLWLDQKGEGMWGSRTVSLKLKNLAGRYRDPATKKSYGPGKQRVTGYRGVRFNDLFKHEFDKAPRNKGGHPVASTSSVPEEYPV